MDLEKSDLEPFLIGNWKLQLFTFAHKNAYDVYFDFRR